MNELEKKEFEKAVFANQVIEHNYALLSDKGSAIFDFETLTIFLSDTCKQGYKQLQVKNYPNIKPFMIHSQSLKLIILKFFLMKTLNKANKPELNVHLVFYN